MVNWIALAVFIFFFIVVTVVGFVAARWRRGDLTLLNEWGLAGRRFGTVIVWFLLGGDIYTAYTFVAVPGLVYGVGALGFFAVPYTIFIYPIVFVLMPRFWRICQEKGYVTPSDFVEGQFGSRTLALVIAVSGIVATMPYIALQMFGIAVSVAQMGINPEIALIIAFLILAAYTYTSGLRAPAMISLIKDAMIFIVLMAVIIVIPIALGGFAPIFQAAQAKAAANPAFHLTLAPAQFLPYTTLALGSALALFLYPHTLTGTLSSSSREVIKRNAALLPAYTLLLGLLALMGFMAIAAHVVPPKAYGANGIVPALIAKMFPSWFAGFAFAAIAVGAMVPASIMSIAAANLFTRNIYRPYFRPNYTAKEETSVAKVTSLAVKLGALLFIILVPTTFVINFQLLGGIIIIQTLPAVFLGLFTRWLNRWALVTGWAVGIASGLFMFIAAHNASVYTFVIGGHPIGIYSALASVVLNLVVGVALTPVFRSHDLQKLNRKLQEMASGGGDFTQRVEVVQLDAVGEIIESLNRFIEKLRRLFLQVVDSAERVTSSSVTLRTVLGRTTAATEEMVASIEQISSNAASHKGIVKSTEGSLATLLGSLERISRNVDSQASSVEETSNAITQMAASIKAVSQATSKANGLAANLIQVAHEGEVAVDGAVKAARNLEESSQQVNAIVTAISRIAAQTNLLAMNATIEAAHAGDAGRGFAVVAEEVRNLAENSAASAKQIATHVKSMSGLIDSEVKLSEGTGHLFVRISQDIGATTSLVNEIAAAMQEQYQGANEIVAAMSSLVSSTQEVRRIADEQKVASVAMRESIATLVQIFSDIQGATEEQARGNREIIESVTDLQTVAGENQEVVSRLQSLLQGFNLGSPDAEGALPPEPGRSRGSGPAGEKPPTPKESPQLGGSPA